MHRVHVLQVEFIHAVHDRLQAPLDQTQRGAQFVGDVGHHMSTQPLRLVQSIGHGVEGPPQPTNLVPGAHRHPLAQVASGDGLHCSSKIPNRGGDVKEED